MSIIGLSIHPYVGQIRYAKDKYASKVYYRVEAKRNKKSSSTYELYCDDIQDYVRAVELAKTVERQRGVKVRVKKVHLSIKDITEHQVTKVETLYPKGGK